MMDFVKMHGAGNDYVYVDLFSQKLEKDPAELAPVVSDRHFGIGSDGLILIEPSDSADAGMRMFNADGSEAEMCGNGIRCVAKYLVDEGLAGESLTVATLRGILKLRAFRAENGLVDKVRVGMGKPEFDPAAVPVEGLGKEPVLDRPVSYEGVDIRISVLSMGNPHCVVFVDNVREYPVLENGSVFEKASFFPAYTNVEFVEIIRQNEVRIRTWERGSGETLACGTGASAVCAVLRHLHGWDGIIKADLLGGRLELEWTEEQVYMTGPAEEVFRGTYKCR